ncbi:MAG: hypothetical protein JKX85_11950 [Phycisphaeraceae bacterium]|nr:hypothetical protein [Phycisphaeraceae bacterium]
MDYIAGANGLGDGTLTAASIDTLTWTPPGGTVGLAVTIANGETKVLEGGGVGGAITYIRVTRTSVTNLTGTATLLLAYVVNDVAGFDDTTSAEAAAGDIEYRCLCLRNEHPTNPAVGLSAYIGTLGTQRTSDTGVLAASGAGTISTSGSFADWPESGFAHILNAGATREIVYYASRTDTVLTVPAAGRGQCGTTAALGVVTDTIDAVPGIEVAFEVPSSGTATTGSVQLLADEDTAPTGLTFIHAMNSAGGSTHASLGVGEIIYLWIKQTVVVGTESFYRKINMPKLAFESV